MNKKKLIQWIILIISFILIIGVVIKGRSGFYLSEVPLLFGVLIVVGILLYIVRKIKPPSSAPLSLEGIWTSSDGSTKIFGSNGICQNMMDRDIGGQQTYVLSNGKDSNDRYTLIISHPPNERTLYVKDSGEGEVGIFDGGGNLLWTMTKK